MKTGKLPGNKIPKRARELMSKKSKLGAKISRLRDWRHAEKLINEFETTEMELSEFYIRSRLDKEKAVANHLKKNPGYFFKYAKKFAAHQSSISHLLDSEGEPVPDNLEMAEILSAQYQSVFTTPMYSNLEEALRDFPDTVSPVGDTLSEINITENKVRTAVSKLSFNASAGPDGVPASVIKNGGEFVISALTDIFQLCRNP